MKSPDAWKKLPTPAELLENPRVRAVVDRLNPTVVTARVRGFLDEVHRDLSHRAEEAGLPTPSELAERVSRYLTGESKHQLSGAINATGRLRGGPWVSAPLADAALEQMLLASQDYTLSHDDAPVGAEAAELLCELTGAEAALVVHSHTGALEAALRSLASGGVVVARGEVATIEPGCRLTELANAAGANLVEVGAADGVSLNDYQSALNEGRSLLRMARSDRGAELACRPDLEQLIQAARNASATAVVEMDGAALGAVEGLEILAGPTASDAVAWGADLVLIRGDGLLGGPRCGLVLGRQSAVDRLIECSIDASIKLDMQRAAALAATLRLHAHDNQAVLSIPILSLASTPVENLRTRAERISPQIAASPLVGRAEAVELPDPVAPGVPLDGTSWGVRVWPANGTPDDLAASLRLGSPAVVASPQQGGLLLDLRTVFPRQDIALVAAFADSDSVDPGEQSDSTPAV